MTKSRRNVVITGASRGLGASFARMFASSGDRVALLARSNDATTGLADEIGRCGGEAATFLCDVTDCRSVEGAMRAVGDAFGSVDILINNAGMVDPIARIADIQPADWARHIQTNLIGAFNVLHFGLPLLGSGSVVVNVSSGASTLPVVGRSAYCAGKAGLNMLGRVLGLEEAEQGIRVINFTPGPTDTEMHIKIRAAPINQGHSFKPQILASADDPARFLLWLCSTDAADVSGDFVSARDPALRRRAGMDSQ